MRKVFSYDGEKILTPAQFASTIVVSVKTLHNWDVDGSLVPEKVLPNGQKRYTESQLFALTNMDKYDFKEILTPTQFAKKMNVCTRTLYNWQTSGFFNPHFILPNGQRRYIETQFLTMTNRYCDEYPELRRQNFDFDNKEDKVKRQIWTDNFYNKKELDRLISIEKYKEEATGSNFREYIRQNLGRDDPIGDLAAELQLDRKLPITVRSFKSLYNYLEDARAEYVVLETVKEALKEYMLKYPDRKIVLPKGFTLGD